MLSHQMQVHFVVQDRVVKGCIFAYLIKHCASFEVLTCTFERSDSMLICKTFRECCHESGGERPDRPGAGKLPDAGKVLLVSNPPTW